MAEPSTLNPPQEPTAADVALEGDLSWIQQVRKERDERIQDESLTLGMPTWGDPEHPDLAVEFHVIEKDRLEEFQRESRKQRRKKGGSRAATEADVRFLCEAATVVKMRRPDTDKLIELRDAKGPIRLDKRLGALLGLEDEQMSNSMALLMYLVKDNGVALGSMSVTLARWMTNTSREIAEAVVGE